MQFRPYDSFILHSSLMPDEIRARLEASTGSDSFRLKFAHFPQGHGKPLDGTVWHKGFIVRASGSKNSIFARTLVGKLRPSERGTDIRVTHMVSLPILITVLGVPAVALAYCLSLFSLPYSMRAITSLVLVGLIAALGVYSTISSFQENRIPTRDWLAKLLDAKLEADTGLS